MAEFLWICAYIEEHFLFEMCIVILVITLINSLRYNLEVKQIDNELIGKAVDLAVLLSRIEKEVNEGNNNDV